jgi:hypothetical protein
MNVELTELVVAGIGGELDDVERQSSHWALAESVDPGDVWTSGMDRCQDLWQLLVVMVPEFESRGRYCCAPCFTGECRQQLRKDKRTLERSEVLHLWNKATCYNIRRSIFWPPPVSILSQTNPVHITPTHLYMIHPNIIHSPTSWSS